MIDSPERRARSAQASPPKDNPAGSKGGSRQFWTSGTATARLGPSQISRTAIKAETKPVRPHPEGSSAWPAQQPVVTADASSLVADEPCFLGESQREAADVIRLALVDRHVFVALTGAPGFGKTLVLSSAISGQLGRSLRTIKLESPGQVSAEQAGQIERSVLEPAPTQAGAFHTVLVVDDAHTASPALLRSLARIAEIGRLNPGSPQVILAGRPELWDRLKAVEFAPLLERIAVRPVLRPMTDTDARGLVKHLLDQPRRIFGQALAADAEQEVLRRGEGRPERIRTMLQSALTLGDLQTRPQISIEMIRSTAAMLDGLRPPRGRKRRARIVIPALVTLTVVAAVVGLTSAERGWPFDPQLATALDFASRVVPWRMRSADDTTPMRVEAAQQAPADRLGADNAPEPVADAPQAELAQAAPLPAIPAALPLAIQDETDRPVAENQLPSPPAPLDPTPSETHDLPVAAASASPVLADQPLETERAPDVVEAPGAIPTVAAIVAPDPMPSEADLAGPKAAAGPRPMPGNAPAPLAPGVVATLLRRGDEVLALGDVSTARRFYERTIAAGSALGARGVARTYDPAVVGRGNPAANPAAATAWYNMAAALDDVDASARRATLKEGR